MKGGREQTGVSRTSRFILQVGRDSRVDPEPEANRFFLGFDCATKTFAYGLVEIDCAAFRAAEKALAARLAALTAGLEKRGDLAALTSAAAALDRDTRAFFRIIDGGVVDLFPGRADSSVSTTERLKAISRLVETVIRPSVAAAVPAGALLSVLVEFQMGQNARTRAVAAALIALFHRDNVFLVGPSLKNRVYFTEEGRYCYFIQRYKTTYAANKNHAKFNFAYLERLFGTKIPPTRPAGLRGHIADSIMQIVGFLMYGPDQPDKMF
jgi:hypothetical protein